MTIDLDVHLKAIVERDASAFGKWLAGAEEAMRKHLREFAHAVDLESVVQETMLRVWQFAPRVVPDGGPNALLRYANKIGRNQALQELRRIHPTLIAGDEIEYLLDAATAQPISAPDPILRRVIAECRDKLPPQPRRALEARFTSQGGRADDDLAAELGMRLNTFLQNFGRARQFLADCLEERGVTGWREIRS